MRFFSFGRSSGTRRKDGGDDEICVGEVKLGESSVGCLIRDKTEMITGRTRIIVYSRVASRRERANEIFNRPRKKKKKRKKHTTYFYSQRNCTISSLLFTNSDRSVRILRTYPSESSLEKRNPMERLTGRIVATTLASFDPIYANQAFGPALNVDKR